MTNSHEIYVIADNIRSLYNVGSLFRLSDGVGVKKLYLCGTTGAPYERVKYQRQRQQIAKTALEGLTSVEWEYYSNISELITRLKQHHIQIVAVEQTAKSIPYTDFKYDNPICLILGNETEGVTSDVIDLVDATVELPMLGRGKSLNVISAASAVLYHIRSQTTEK